MWLRAVVVLGAAFLAAAAGYAVGRSKPLPSVSENLRAPLAAAAAFASQALLLAGLRDGRVIELPGERERFRFEGTFVALASAAGVIAACTSNDARIQFSNSAEVIVNGPCHAIEAGVDRVLVASSESIVEVRPSSVPRVVFRGAEHSTAIAANGDEPLFAGNESGEVRWFINGALEGIWREAGPVTALAVVAVRRIVVAPRGQSVAMISIPPKARERSPERRALSEDLALARFNETHARAVPALALVCAPVLRRPRRHCVLSRTLSARIPIDDGPVRPLSFIDETHLVTLSHHAWEITSRR